ncbi:hypothetical protein TBLA_0D00270 [Henningerozyma blattae CBS 6284]|uniref:Uncharacterized protein n=1 Tax=Henningerozyma blattae (strain ATCC 34711 / CBS 6284 / DSM 70876 / NBRC 10599 / NRRL Y-10934 / UCD 77-7) TaxID=1071380 RepID=I2H2D5_HENB6|nr:hypothetical protein TBLA_0D00270 [Tetrapisispora blattae CBS 6284]CCH60537.1 hypothetical protein TBLA_0D00270 [Tetrapisispora blattae CBS 6284]
MIFKNSSVLHACITHSSIRPITTQIYLQSHLQILRTNHKLSSTSKQECIQYKKWFQLSFSERELFAKRFISNYAVQYPGSNTLGSLEFLYNQNYHIYKTEGQHSSSQRSSLPNSSRQPLNVDDPCIFGVFYNDIHRINSLLDTTESTSRFQDRSFRDLLVKM